MIAIRIKKKIYFKDFINLSVNYFNNANLRNKLVFIECFFGGNYSLKK